MIVLRDSDIPAGVTAEQAVALVVGIERAKHETIVVIRTQYPDSPFEQRPADQQSVGQPVTRPEHAGLSFADLERAASAAGLDLTTTPAGYRLAGPHGALTRATLGELVDAIKHPKDILYGQYDAA